MNMASIKIPEMKYFPPITDLPVGGASLRYPSRRKRQQRSRLICAAWNIRTLTDGGPNNRSERRTAHTDRGLCRLIIEIVALRETRLSGEVSTQERNYTFFWKEREPGLHRQHWVIFAVKSKLLDRHSEAPTGTSELLVTYRLQIGKGKPRNLVSMLLQCKLLKKNSFMKS